MKKIKLEKGRVSRLSVDGHRFRVGGVVEVPNDLAEELLKGSDRVEGFTFKAATKKDEKEAEAQAEADVQGGIAGDGPPSPDPAGTTTAQAR